MEAYSRRVNLKLEGMVIDAPLKRTELGKFWGNSPLSWKLLYNFPTVPNEKKIGENVSPLGEPTCG